MGQLGEEKEMEKEKDCASHFLTGAVAAAAAAAGGLLLSSPSLPLRICDHFRRSLASS